MYIALYLVSNTVSLLLGVLGFAMFLRAILSFFPAAEEWRFTEYLYYLTEIAVSPVRAVLTKFSGIDGSPLDLSFIITYLLISFLQMSLPTVSL